MKMDLSIVLNDMSKNGYQLSGFESQNDSLKNQGNCLLFVPIPFPAPRAPPKTAGLTAVPGMPGSDHSRIPNPAKTRSCASDTKPAVEIRTP